MASVQRALLIATAAIFLAGIAATAIATPSAGAQPVAAHCASDGEIHLSYREITLKGGRRLKYTIRAGWLPLVNDDTGETTAQIYFVAYTADEPPGANPRPITFGFPGGPGSTETPSPLGPLVLNVRDGHAEVADNPNTLLAATDLVFVDPVGSGYSRMTKPAYAKLFYGILPDRDSLVEFMRIYLKRYDPAESPIFLTGESYGSIRSVLVAQGAMERGIPIQGIMISAEGITLGLNGNDLGYAVSLPAFTVAAWAHHLLPPDLQADRNRAIAAATSWAEDVYLPALVKGNTLSADERHKVALGMARLTGLRPEFIEANNLRVGREAFSEELLRDQGKSIGLYDDRITGTLSGSYDPTHDPSLMALGVAYPSLAERMLLNGVLGMRSDRLYAGPFGGSWPVHGGYEDWMASKWHLGMSNEITGIGADMFLPVFVKIVDKGVQVLIGGGYYDTAGMGFFGSDYLAARVPPEEKDRVHVVHYESGHMVPSPQFATDSAEFIKRVLEGPLAKAPHPIIGD